MTKYLLDVNLLLALTDPLHTHHEIAHNWFTETEKEGWATCPLTENSFVRIASHPRYPNRPGDVRTVLSLLRQFCRAEGHELWVQDITLRKILLPDAVITSKQITDVYLLGLAIHKGGQLATLDRRIPSEMVRGGNDGLTVIQ